MTTSSRPHSPRPPGERSWVVPFVLGTVVGFATAFLLVGIVSAVIVGLWAFGATDGETLTEMPHATLKVAKDGCGVIRTDFGDDPPDGLQWAVTDQQGFQVLGRNALGETRYRYYRAGDYRVVLEAFDGEKYVPVSNRVEIQCP